MSAEPRTWWGWHQLTDSWSRRLVETVELTAHDIVLDIGAGEGRITRHLVDTGARVIAVELHARRAARLRSAFGSRVTVVQTDARDLRLPKRPFVVVANPPFSATTALLRRLLGPHSQLSRAALVVPRHTAERWAYGAAPGAQRWRRRYRAEVGPTVSRSAFRPPPPRDASVLLLRRWS